MYNPYTDFEAITPSDTVDAGLEKLHADPAICLRQHTHTRLSDLVGGVATILRRPAELPDAAIP